jgi:hypothetical protein
MDTRAYRRRSPAEIAQLVAEYKSSGLSPTAFCREKRMNRMTLQAYQLRQQKQLSVAPGKGGRATETAVRAAEVGPRRHRNRAEADQLAAEYEASGLRREEFCVQKNVPMKTLARYLARRRREQKGKEQRPQWVAVEVARSRAGGGEFVVSLAGGRRIEVRAGFDADTLRQLVSVLERV